MPDTPVHDVGEEDYDLGHEAQRHGQRRTVVIVIATVVLLAALGLGLGFGLSGSSGPPPGPEGVPLQNVPDLASPDSTVSGAPVDGITCRKTMDQGVNYHIHVRLDIYVDGKAMRIPAGAGIVPPRLVTQQPGGTFVDNDPSSCLYWLHVHADDGIIHVEAPHQEAFTLGQFFDVWNQPLTADQVGPAKGQVAAFVNGRTFTGDPRAIPLVNLEVVQLDVGSPVVPFHPLHFTVTGSCSTSCGPPSSGG